MIENAPLKCNLICHVKICKRPVPEEIFFRIRLRDSGLTPKLLADRYWGALFNTSGLVFNKFKPMDIPQNRNLSNPKNFGI